MIYIDQPFQVPLDHPTAPRCFRGKMSAHLQADTEDELRAYAREIGLKESWIQYPGTPKVHFDLTGKRLAFVLADSRVKRVSMMEMPFANWCKEQRTLAQSHSPEGSATGLRDKADCRKL